MTRHDRHVSEHTSRDHHYQEITIQIQILHLSLLHFVFLRYFSNIISLIPAQAD